MHVIKYLIELKYLVKILKCNRMGKMMTDQTRIRTQALWISSQGLYQLSYLAPVRSGLTFTDMSERKLCSQD